MKPVNKVKPVKVLLWIVAVLVILGVIIIIGWHWFKKDLAKPDSKIAKPIVTHQIKKMLADASYSLYTLTYNKFDLDINAGHGLITHIKLVPDSAIFKRLVAVHKAPANVFDATIDSVVIKNLGFAKTNSGRRLTVGAILIYHPVIKITNRLRFNRDTAGKQSILMKLAKSMLHGITIKSMAVKNLTLVYVNQNQKAPHHTALKNLDVNITGFTVDSGKMPGLQLSRLKFSTPDSLYYIKLDGMQLSQRNRSLFIKRTEIEPRLGIKAFYKAVHYDKDRIHMLFNNMQLNHIDIPRFIKTQQLHIGNMATASSWGEVFNNYDEPRREPPIRINKYPQQRLQKLALDITIDTFMMHKGIISYKMAAKKSGRVADFFLSHSESRYYNITNNVAAKKRNPYATAYLNTRVMDAVNLQCNFKFNLTAKNGAYNYTFRMGKMDGRALNPLSKPLALMQVDSADISKMLLQVNATDTHATGHIDLYYTNMKISLLKEDKNTDTLKKKKFLSFLTNVVLPNSNPNRNGKFRAGPINVTRPPRMSFLGFMYKGMLDGMSSLISGLNQHKDKPDKNTVISIGKNFAKPQPVVKKKGVIGSNKQNL